MSKILLIGESCQDITIEVDYTRNSPEDNNVPIYQIEKKTVSDGMVRIVSDYLNKQEIAHELLTNLTVNDIVKTRVILNGKQIQRIDQDDNVSLDSFSIDWLKEHINEFDIVCISDYGKGLMNKEIIDVVNNCSAKMVLDPHPNNNISQYKNVYLVKLNENELEAFAGTNNLTEGTETIRRLTGARHVVITMGKGGMYCDGLHVPSLVTNCKRVSGAGDVTTASIVKSIVNNESIDTMLHNASKLVKGYIEC